MKPRQKLRSLKIYQPLLFLADGLISLYGWLPSKVKRALLPLGMSLFSGLRRLMVILSQIRLPVFLLEGIEKNGESSMRVLTAGKEGGLPYLKGLFFSEVRHQRRIGKVFFWNLRSLSSNQALRPEIVVVWADAFYMRLLKDPGFFILPEWVSFGLELSTPLEKNWDLPGNKTVRENLRRIRKYGYTYEISSSRSRFESFYNEMYMPYIPQKFGDATSLVSLRKMKIFLKCGVLLLVEKNGESISGNIIMSGLRQAKSIVIGLSAGDVENLRKAALSASYYFTMLWAQKQGFKWLDFGECRPFLNDGLLYYKKRWGMILGDNKLTGNVFGIKACSVTPSVKSFLVHNPFIYREGKKLVGIVFMPADASSAVEDLEKLKRRYFVTGLDHLVVVSEQGFHPETVDGSLAGIERKVFFVRSPMEEFLRSFTHRGEAS